jgi:CrcB protein
MRKYLYIMAGGAMGAVSRVAVKNLNIAGYQGSFPLNTLIINVTGSFVLALFLTLTLDYFEFDADLRLAVSTGFLGGYTTFSTLCKETSTLISNGMYGSAGLYIGASAMLGLAAAYAGVIAARAAAERLTDRGDLD